MKAFFEKSIMEVILKPTVEVRAVVIHARFAPLPS